MKSTHRKKEMYMANVKVLRWVPNATYIALTGGFTLGVTQILGFALGVTKIFTFSDTNKFCVAVEYRL